MTNYKVPTLETFEWQTPVLDKDLYDPPISPNKGDRYIISYSPFGSASGDWAGHELNITTWTGLVWDFVIPTDGFMCWIKDEFKLYFYNIELGIWEQEKNRDNQLYNICDIGFYNLDYRVDYTGGALDYIGTVTGDKIAQNFGFGGAVTIYRITLYYAVTDRDQGIKLQIQNVDGFGKPNGTILWEKNIPDDWEVVDYSAHFITFDIPGGLHLPGHTGAWSLVITDLSDSHSFALADKQNVSGHQLWKWDGVSDWTIQSTGIVCIFWILKSDYGEIAPNLSTITESTITDNLVFPKGLKINDYTIKHYESAVEQNNNFILQYGTPGLIINITSGKFDKWNNGNRETIDVSAGDLTLTAETTNYIYINNSNILETGVSLPSSVIFLYEIVTDISKIVSVIDKRSVLTKIEKSTVFPFFIS